MAPARDDDGDDVYVHRGNRTLPVAVLQDAPANLAIGVEFKFLVPFLLAGSVDPCPGDDRPIAYTSHAGSQDRLQDQAYKLITDILRTSAKQPAISISDIKAQGWQESDFWTDHWIVKKSNSAEPGPEEQELAGCLWASLEISSPKLPALDPRTLSVLRTVVRALNRHCRITVNYSCEIHVHLGRTDGEAFSLTSLKNLASLCWLTEPTLRLLKDPSSPNFNHIYTWSSPLREHSRLAKSLAKRDFTGRRKRAGALMDMEEMMALTAIFNASDYVALGRLLSGDTKPFRRLGFNFSAFGLEDERAGRSPRSVEVRFLEGYWGEDEVLGWVEVCIALAVVAVEEPKDRLFRLVTRLTRLEGTEGRLNGGAQHPAADVDLPGERLAVLMTLLSIRPEVIATFRAKADKIYG